MSHARVLNRQTMLWLPAAVLLTAALLAATGFRVTPPSHAASAGSTVQATVLPDLQIGGTCSGATITGSLPVGAEDTSIGSSCTVTYATNNNTAGVRLRAESTRPDAPALCKNSSTAVNCGAVDTFADAATAGIVNMADGAFGVQVAATPTCTTATGSWVNGTSYGLAAGSGPGSIVCAQHNMGAGGSYTMQFRADTTASHAAGLYHAGASFFLEAL